MKQKRGQQSLDGFPAERPGVDWDEAGRDAALEGYLPELVGAARGNMGGEEIDFAAPLLEAIEKEVSGDPVYSVNDPALNSDIAVLESKIEDNDLDLSVLT